jgi:hypothetical protein
MSRLRLPDFSEGEPATMNADLDASVLDEDAWEDATDEASGNSEMLRHSQWRSSALDTVD